MKINDYVTYINTPEDVVYLRTKLLPVNMRLFNLCDSYRVAVMACCNHIRNLALIKYEDYGCPFGMSGANAAIPFNIIGLVKHRDKKDASCMIMINPEIKREGIKIDTITNCGSIRLKKSIKVRRWDFIKVEYYTENGEYKIEDFYREDGAFTIQHEIDHNNGILITDY